MAVLIRKSDGTQEPFEEHKLVESLSRAGADGAAASQIAGDISRALRPGATTGEIYRHAFARLREHRRGIAARYSLKRAVLDLGPSGFPFESYLAELFEAEGWRTQVDQMVQGRCVEHEVDLVLEREGEEPVFVEAKFHNTAGFKTDLKTVLYVEARTEDIGHGLGLVATNTKFTSVAVRYATCRGLGLLAWDYPQGRTLHERIEAARLFPITALTSLSRREKMALLEARIVLCRDLQNDTRALATAGVGGRKAAEVLEEAGVLCASGKAV